MIPEPVSSAAAENAISEVSQAAEGLLKRLLGPAIDEAGLILQDKVRVYRLKNTLRALDRVRALLSEANIEPRQVPLRALLPLLDGVSLEDDEFLREKWARLLASAASSTDEYLAHPSFARILSEMSAREAKLLDLMDSAIEPKSWPQFRTSAAKQLGVIERVIDQDYGNLFRLGICRIRSHGNTLGDGTIEIGPFGSYFLSAIRGPKRVGA